MAAESVYSAYVDYEGTTLPLTKFGEGADIPPMTDHKRFKKFIREGKWPSNHVIRPQLWRQVAETNLSHSMVFKEMKESLFGTSGRELNHKLPIFLEKSHMITYHLNESGLMAMRTILTIIAHLYPDITYCPLLPPITSLLLHYLDEESAYMVVATLLEDKEGMFLDQTRISFEVFLTSFIELVKKYDQTSKSYIAAQHAGNVDLAYANWIWWIFKDLPFSYLIRVLDCFLYEGSKVFYRIGLAILGLYKKHEGDVEDYDPNSISTFTKVIPCSEEKLLKSAFKIKYLSKHDIRKLTSKSKSSIVTSEYGQVDGMGHADMIALERINSSILSHEQLHTLWRWLPQRKAIHQPVLLFTTEQHGFSLQTLYAKCDQHDPIIIVIETLDDEVFGAYVCSKLQLRRKHEKNLSYFGTGECFLYCLYPNQKKFPWIGSLSGFNITHSSSLFLSADNERIIIGGGQNCGLQLDANLDHGTTRKCETFNNPPLCSNDFFRCKIIEVIGLRDD